MVAGVGQCLFCEAQLAPLPFRTQHTGSVCKPEHTHRVCSSVLLLDLSDHQSFSRLILYLQASLYSSEAIIQKAVNRLEGKKREKVSDNTVV